MRMTREINEGGGEYITTACVLGRRLLYKPELSTVCGFDTHCIVCVL